ncbi:MAG: late control protein D, partial [Clostridium sp.]|nr:late control protein D [Clostridium sp.]
MYFIQILYSTFQLKIRPFFNVQNYHFYYTYKLWRERGIWQEKLYNDKIKGISLEGEVLEVSGEKVK